MPLERKRKSSPVELDLDALFADLDATVQSSSSQHRATPTTQVIAKPQTPRSARAKLSQSPANKRHEDDLAALVDGLVEAAVIPTLRASSSKPVTPVKAKSVSTSPSTTHVYALDPLLPDCSPSLLVARPARVSRKRTSMRSLKVSIGTTSTNHLLLSKALLVLLVPRSSRMHLTAIFPCVV